MKLFECTVRYRNTQNKRKREVYMLDALSCAEAEARIIKELQTYGATDIAVISLKVAQVNDVVNGQSEAEDQQWYRVKISLITINERTGEKKKAPFYVLIHDDSIDACKQDAANFMHGTLSDWKLSSVAETKIVDVLLQDGEAG